MYLPLRRVLARAFQSCVTAIALSCTAALAAAPSGVEARQEAAQSATFNLVASLSPDDGHQFWNPMTQGADGLMYSTAMYGGGANDGTVFRVEADGTVTVVHAFSGSDGNWPGPLTLGTDGWLYGTTSYGGASGMGNIFKVSTSGDFVALHEFSADADQGLQKPTTPLVPDGQGGFYAAGSFASKPTAGVLFHYDASGTITILGQFAGTKLGRGPNSLVRGPDGTLYGTTMHGPTRNSSGTFFSYKPGGRLKTIHNFDYNTEGNTPTSPIVFGPDGAIYGLLRSGYSYDGVIYRMTTKGAFTRVHGFTTSDPLGYGPWGGLSIDASGTLYGTTAVGGKLQGGTAFSMTKKGVGKLLHAFGSAQGANGYDAATPPTWVPGGSLWGTMTMGGQDGNGTVYRIDLGQ